MPRPLTITPTPFKSSFLSIPPSPFSPQLPITPQASPRKTTSRSVTALKLTTTGLTTPPSDPLHWLWQCHRCHRIYQLGVTRRCLDDGHFFCAGTTTVKRSKKNPAKKVVRHQACASEFDYQGWKTWGTWRRDLAEQVEAAEALLGGDEGEWLAGLWPRALDVNKKGKEDCWNRCDYPSECRWGKQFGVQTPVMAKPVQEQKSTTQEESKKSKTSFNDILLSIADVNSPDYLEPLSTTTSNSAPAAENDILIPSMDDLLQSAKRRKRRSSGQVPIIPSPLGTNPPEKEGPVLRKSTSSSKLEGFEGLGELRDKADAFMHSFRGAKVKLSAGTI